MLAKLKAREKSEFNFCSYNNSMIRNIKIENIQSHKKTEIKFSSGINAIVGSSNNGKSAVLRALYWAVYNRPLGTDTLLSHWATDKKGNQIAPMSVTVENDNGMVTRRRTKTENQYIVNGMELNVVKTDVPEQVDKILCLGDTNIQKQQDAPFLLSMTSGQVAQYFNKTVRLDVIDKVLSNTESKRRKTANEIKQVDDLLLDFNQRLEKYSWLDSVEKLLVKYDNVTNKVNEIEQTTNNIKNQICVFDEYKKIIEEFNEVTSVKNLIVELLSYNEKLNNIIVEKDKISDDLKIMDNCKKTIYPSFKSCVKTINEINDTFDKIKAVRSDSMELEEQIEKFEYCNDMVNNKKMEVEKLRKQLPDICPLCGAVMKHGKCTEEKINEKYV